MHVRFSPNSVDWDRHPSRRDVPIIASRLFPAAAALAKVRPNEVAMGRAMMDFARRQFLRLALGTTALPMVTQKVSALEYPSRPVRIIVSLPAGLAPDIDARLIAQPLSERLGQSVVVENRPGANSNIGTEFVVKALPDGYTLLLLLAGNAINTTLYPKLTFNLTRDLVPVAFVGATSWIMVLNPSVPAKTVPEFIAYAKAHPGKINMASPGTGSPPHLAGELFKMLTGVNFVHVPYRQSYLPDLLGGQVQVAFAAIASLGDYIRGGKLRALGVTTKARSTRLPDIPALDEFIPGYEASGWLGIAAPKRTPEEIVGKLNNDINAVIGDPTVKSKLLSLDIEPQAMTPKEFGKLISDETDKWEKVIKFANIKVG
jgi:tripartite-type tricarboxylate transporter receptor subunit TctC